jgi:hypothetical protein
MMVAVAMTGACLRNRRSLARSDVLANVAPNHHILHIARFPASLSDNLATALPRPTLTFEKVFVCALISSFCSSNACETS